MDLSVSAFTMPALYRLGERSILLKGSRLRSGIYRILESQSRNKAVSARRAFESASSQPAYLELAELDAFIQRYHRAKHTRSDQRLPAEKAHQRALEVMRHVRQACFSRRGPLRILDLACGDGLTADAMQSLGANVTAIDLTPARFGGACDFKEMDASAMTFPGNTFDVIYTFDAFEHFSNPTAVLSEAHRVLKPGGLLFASFGPLYNSPHGAHQFLSIDVPYCHHLFRESDCNAAAEARGLRPLTKNLNYWSLRDFRKLFDGCSEQFGTLTRFEKFNVAFVDLIRQYPTCFRSKVTNFDELIVRSIEVLVRKTESR